MDQEEKKAICDALSWLTDIESVRDRETLERAKQTGLQILEGLSDSEIKEHFRHLAGMQLIKFEVALKWK